MINPQLIPATQTYPIVCLEHQATYLYAELIQVIETRQLYWVRPLILAISTAPTALPFDGEVTCYDLRQTADLLWPLECFRSALDTEVLPLFTRLQTWETSVNIGPTPTARQHLQQFICQAWQSYSNRNLGNEDCDRG